MSSPATLAIVGARLRTLDPDRPAATAIAIRGGEIAAVGSDAEIGELCAAGTAVIDGAGMTVVPGLVDSHLHPIWGTDFAVGFDASNCTDIETLRAGLAAERRRQGAAGVVRAWGVDYGLFADAMDGEVLARLAGGPALIVFFDMHTFLATPDVLDLAGLDGTETFPDGSAVVVRDGRATGELREFSPFFQVLGALGEDSVERRLDRVVELQRRLNAVGLTGAHVMDGSPETFELLRALEETGDLTMRLRVPLWIKPEHDDRLQESLLRHRDERGELWRGGVAKFFIDGVVETGTAWFEEPDCEGEGLEPYWPDPQRYAAAVARFAGAGFQCITHAIGDRAVRAALDAYLTVPRPRRGMHRIEHFESLGDETLARFAREGVAASAQPLHMRWRQPDGSDEWSRRLGPRRAGLAFRTGDMLRSGATLTLGSDWPVAPYDPRYGMAWARLRRAPGRPDIPPFGADQTLTGPQALDGYTATPALVAGEGDRSGRLQIGMRADLTAFADDPAEVPADDLPDLPVELTVVDGRVVFRRG